MTPAKKKKKSPGLTDAHKAALATGRAQGRAVRQYLEAFEAHKPKRGRRRTPESINKRLEALEQEIPAADPLKRVQLIQERLDLQQQAASAVDRPDLVALEAEFVEVARAYSESKGISYAAWRELGIPPVTLKAAGIARAV